MNKHLILSFSVLAFASASVADIATFRLTDPRNLCNGTVIPAENYCDQPYVVATTNGEWVCVLTTGTGIEGQPGQHVVSCISTNRGVSWSELVDIEPSDGPEASWATPLLTPSGRIYAFYTYNGDKVETLPGSTMRCRTDMLGWYCFKFSDDNGRSWSEKRYRIPIPVTACDRANQWGGEVQIFWGIDKPKISDGTVYFAFTKLGRYMLEMGEGWIVSSGNILTESDPEKIRFEILPGDQASGVRSQESGIRNPAFGSVQEEFNLVPLGGAKMLSVNRTTRGVAAQSYSSDAGRSWSVPVAMTYTPGGRDVKTPRACPKLFKTSEGKFLFWYHNHGGRSYKSRNPVFLSGGVLNEDGTVHWSEPEIVLFDPDPAVRVSYPDLIEESGEFWLTETQKSTARVHKIDRSLLEGMWSQDSNKAVCKIELLVEKTVITESRDGAVTGSEATPLTPPASSSSLIPESSGVERVDVPAGFGRLDKGGFSVECWFDVKSMKPGAELFDTIGDDGRGVRIVNLERDGKRILQIELCDGSSITAWSSEAGVCLESQLQHVVFICDYSAGIISVVHNGRYCDGGRSRQYGWGRIPPAAGAVRGAAAAECCEEVKVLRLYGRALRTSEAVSNFRAGY